VDHTITLISSSQPVQVQPYRCSQVPNNEIEKLVVEMLNTGVIQPSHSSFSSPVLLVKKKDGIWHFYINFQALN